MIVIAEIGINHNGDIRIAEKLIKMAKACGADAVKFQKRTIEKAYTKKYLDSPRESPWGTTQRDQKRGLEFGRAEYDEIDKICFVEKIPWSASAWDCESQEFLRTYDLPFNKIASPMLTHKPLLRMVAAEKKKTFISTGMSTYAEIDDAVNVFEEAGCPFVLMHTTSTYPCPDDQCNLAVIPELQIRYNCPVGYSGHEVGLLPSIVAAVKGASAIERHITLDRSMYGSDQAASLEEAGLRRLVRDLRNIPTVMGDGVKVVRDCEMKSLKSLRYGA